MVKKFKTNYHVAVNWLNSSLILCNEIMRIDPSVFDNRRFSMFINENGEDCEEEDESAHERDIYQWFLTDCGECEVNFLEKHFGLLFTYSDILDLWVLCVDHLGTRWSYVAIETDLENAAREEGQTE